MAKKTVECKSLGIRLKAETAEKVDQIVSTLPKTDDYKYRVKGSVPETELNPEGAERTDISYINTSVMDRDFELVLPEGIDRTDYNANPMVLWNHEGDKPIGTSDWVKPSATGLIARSKYSQAPKWWKPEVEWQPDFVWAMIEANILRGKSVGLLPLEIRDPTPEELAANPALQRVISKSLLLEYSVVSVPSNPQALVEAINKGVTTLDAWNIKIVRTPNKKVDKTKERQPEPKVIKEVLPKVPAVIPTVDWEKALRNMTFDPDKIAELAIKRIQSRWEV